MLTVSLSMAPMTMKLVWSFLANQVIAKANEKQMLLQDKPCVMTKQLSQYLFFFSFLFFSIYFILFLF